MKLVFAGTPEFASAALEALHGAGHEIVLVISQPDRPAGRGLRPAASAVKRLAQQLGLALWQPASLKDPEALAQLAAVAPEAMIVAAYGQLIPPDILALPARGGINIHASLLPRWRGAAPIQRAILAGDAQTGISIMQMDAGLDTGPVLLEEKIDIAASDTAQTLHDRLAAVGARLIVRALKEPLRAVPQNSAGATYAAKLDKREARLDWNEPAQRIERKVRAFNPLPGANTMHLGTTLKIWRAVVVEGFEPESAGTVTNVDAAGITVACGNGTALKLLELQRAGGKRLPAPAFLDGYVLAAGERLGHGE